MNPKRWRELTERPLIVVSVIFLFAYSWLVIGNLQSPYSDVAVAVLALSWIVFVIDYVVKVAIQKPGRRFRWCCTHLFDLAIVLVPVLQPLRMLRGALQRTEGAAIRSRILLYAGSAASLLLYVGALTVLNVERGEPGADITTFWKALWWAFETITTVGYGDEIPATAIGRFIAIVLMIGGVTLLGVITATFASWIVSQVGQAEEEATATVGHLRALEARIESLEGLLREALKDREGAKR
ncbi:MAG TPA: ion channel [Microbacterium sp.]|uniref:potassium channel family protein n=1 Tax=Microbacterium sp. TaxID=51671 RepID=UPI002B4A5D8D|nr:ion channel [Microbacterium sp.]HKT56258.1 ion channel [Microbacterium sp.]